MAGSHKLETAGDAMVSCGATFVAAPKGVNGVRKSTQGIGRRRQEMPAGIDPLPDGLRRIHALNPALSKLLREQPAP